MDTEPKISVVTPSIRPKGLELVQQSLENQTFDEFEWLVEIGLPSRGNDLNKAYNRLIRRSSGELFVSVQDYIKLPQTFLEDCWKAYKENPNTFYTCPVGKTTNWEEITWDWRPHPDSNVNWQRWEIDAGFCPMKALYEIGGFDEALDEHTWTFDNVNVGLRAKHAGYEFDVLKDNKCVAYNHDAEFDHPFRDKMNPTFHNKRLDIIRKGQFKGYL